MGPKNKKKTGVSRGAQQKNLSKIKIITPSSRNTFKKYIQQIYN